MTEGNMITNIKTEQNVYVYCVNYTVAYLTVYLFSFKVHLDSGIFLL